MNFKESLLTEKVGVRIKTEEQFKQLQNWIVENNPCKNGQYMRWHVYKSKSCIVPSVAKNGNVNYWAGERIEIINFEDALEVKPKFNTELLDTKTAIHTRTQEQFDKMRQIAIDYHFSGIMDEDCWSQFRENTYVSFNTTYSPKDYGYCNSEWYVEKCVKMIEFNEAFEPETLKDRFLRFISSKGLLEEWKKECRVWGYRDGREIWDFTKPENWIYYAVMQDDVEPWTGLSGEWREILDEIENPTLEPLYTQVTRGDVVQMGNYSMLAIYNRDGSKYSHMGKVEEIQYIVLGKAYGKGLSEFNIAYADFDKDKITKIYGKLVDVDLSGIL